MRTPLTFSDIKSFIHSETVTESDQHSSSLPMKNQQTNQSDISEIHVDDPRAEIRRIALVVTALVNGIFAYLRGAAVCSRANAPHHAIEMRALIVAGMTAARVNARHLTRPRALKHALVW